MFTCAAIRRRVAGGAPATAQVGAVADLSSGDGKRPTAAGYKPPLCSGVLQRHRSARWPTSPTAKAKSNDSAPSGRPPARAPGAQQQRPNGNGIAL